MNNIVLNKPYYERGGLEAAPLEGPVCSPGDERYHKGSLYVHSWMSFWRLSEGRRRGGRSNSYTNIFIADFWYSFPAKFFAQTVR